MASFKQNQMQKPKPSVLQLKENKKKYKKQELMKVQFDRLVKRIMAFAKKEDQVPIDIIPEDEEDV